MLGFLAAALLIAAGLAGALFGVLSKRRRVAIACVTLAAAVAGAYAILWTGAALASRDRTLAAGEAKYFCEIDCHLAYSVMRVERMTSLGVGGPRPASGSFLVVTVKTWFDPTTISPRRPLDVPLWPNPREVYLEEAGGRRYHALPGATAALASAGRSSTPLTEPLRPGESYETLLIFDLAADALHPRLFIGNVPPESAFLIGHEASPMAKKAWFSLE